MTERGKPLGTRGEIYSRHADAWIAPADVHFPNIHYSRVDDEKENHLRHHANLIRIYDEDPKGDPSDITLDFVNIGHEEETRVSLSDEVASWLVEALTRLLSKKRDAEIRGEND